MKVEIIKIGNSQGIRIPKPLIEQCGFGTAVELTVRKNCLVVSPLTTARRGWERAFQAMAKRGDDKPVIAEPISNQWDEREWLW
ncbi:MAG: AbrB/MazE/SpoVT family DNA-binding domain-containing protein [Candidatus Melainabacteria bacterium]|nr:AbrB/MazE/SpoVT family DNA-binding domain-containing protein [Candidatus Melainabacteria bacterium]